jgi:superfamily II DNA or RNA helicase
MMKPYDWQIEKMIEPLVDTFSREKTGILAAATGSGKTAAALWIARELGRTPFIIAPKVTLPSWRRHSELTGVKIAGVYNIERLKTGKKEWWLKKLSKQQWLWKLDTMKHILIVDEAHVVTGRRTQNANIIAAAKQKVQTVSGQVRDYHLPVLLMSATLAESPIKLGDAVGYLLGLHNRRNAYAWLLAHGCFQNKWGGLDFPTGPGRVRFLEKLHKELFPKFGVSVRHADIPNFPENQMITELITVSPHDLKDLRAAYDEYDDKEHEASTKDNALVVQLRARQKSEIAKIPAFLETIHDMVEEGNSIVVFLSFRETLEMIDAKLKIPASVILGGQNETERQRNVQRFQDDKVRVCLCMIQAGGVGVDLNDTRGTYPRVSVMSPPVSAVHLVQACGRIHRANNATPSVQYMLIAAGTAEEKVAAKLQVKAKNISAIQDGDLW